MPFPLFRVPERLRFSQCPRCETPRRWGRWALVLLAVLALHWGAARWVGRNGNVINPPPVDDVPVQVELLTAKPVEQAPAPAPAPTPVVKPTPKPAPVAPQKPAAPTSGIPRDEPDAQATATAAAVASAASATAAAQAAQPAPPVPPAPTVPGDKFDVPPSGELRYDTLVNGMMNQTGTIHWINDGQHYEMVVSIPIPFVGPYVYSSKGHIDRSASRRSNIPSSAAAVPPMSLSSIAKRSNSSIRARRRTSRSPTARRTVSASSCSSRASCAARPTHTSRA